MKFSPMGDARFRLWFDRNGLQTESLSCAPLQASALDYFITHGTENPFQYLRKKGLAPVTPFYASPADFMPPETPESRAVDAMLAYGVPNGVDHLARFWLQSSGERRRRIEAAFADEFKHFGEMENER